MSGICVEDSNDKALGIPISLVVSDELKVEDRSRKITFECQCTDAESRIYFC
jgi:hypothetical protein